MARRWDDPDQVERDETSSPEFGRLLFIAIGVAMLLGLTCGVLWMAYHLLKGHFGA
ncbi:hypothetical protein [Luteitalea sp.]